MAKIKYIVIGGSAGSFKVVTEIIDAIPKNFPFTVILALHRLKHIKNGFVEAFAPKSELPVIEPNDKDPISEKKIYIAPANYHLYIEPDKTFALSVEESVNHSRPSIDLTLSSAGHSLKDKVIGIMLSGANKDGAVGLKHIKENGGITIVQCPEDSMVRTMPDAAIKEANPEKILTSQQIIEYIVNLKK
ncbi:MAG: chemotaxis protein CheB [Bacteroidales bacterium]|nr:chemotaxis protein CheB [Bacteroidales bacterium]